MWITLSEADSQASETIASTREYLVTRYGPELTSTLAQLNRLAATLDEVAVKVR